jgi:hypothetical protein
MYQQYFRQIPGQSFRIKVHFDTAHTADVKVYRQGLISKVIDKRYGADQEPFETDINESNVPITWHVESVSEAKLMDSTSFDKTDRHLAFGFRDEEGDNRYNSVVVLDFHIPDSGASIPPPPSGQPPLPPLPPPPPPDVVENFYKLDYLLNQGDCYFPANRRFLLINSHQSKSIEITYRFVKGLVEYEPKIQTVERFSTYRGGCVLLEEYIKIISARFV